LQFVFIDERDRDSIVQHIATIQLKRIRQLREKYLFRAGQDGEDEENGQAAVGVNRQDLVKKVLMWGVMILVGLALITYFKHYTDDRPKNEIGEAFEDALKKYIEKQK
jgi:hypothetical protein